MLSELRIQDFAIIEDLHIDFERGFVVFTGETGAGKSILIDAVEMLLGGRADSTMVRTGSKVALIEGAFRLDPLVRDEVLTILEREGLADDAEEVLLGREVRAEGRNLCRVNGRTVTLTLMREIGDLLVDVHGQSEHLSLLRVREHLHLLDRYAQADEQKQTYRVAYENLTQVRSELRRLRQREKEAAQRADMLRYQINEIEAAALKPGEEEQLLAERTRLANAEQLTSLAGQAIAALDSAPTERDAGTDLLGKAAHALSGLAKIDASMQEMQTDVQALVEQVSEVARRLRIYMEEIEFDPDRLDVVEERVDLIRTLKRKYGESIENILRHAAQAHEELESITHAEERIQRLELQEHDLLEQVGQLGMELSKARREAAKDLSRMIESELSELRMEGARFHVDMQWEEQEGGVPLDGRSVAFGPDGLDQVEFMVEPNPGEGLKPLVRIASGGETSRLMLGLKSVLAKADRTPTLIFDEIDQGIGGRVGAIVGRKMWGLAHDHQVLCVTHLPQLGAFGDQHLKVEKVLEAGRTVTVVNGLSDAERIPEMAQMLGGATESNLESAAELLRTAREQKEETLAAREATPT